jgi:hypothetical protein
MPHKLVFSTLSFLLFHFFAFSQENKFQIQVPKTEIQINASKKVHFDNLSTDFSNHNLPFISESYKILNNLVPNFSLLNIKTRELNANELEKLKAQIIHIGKDFLIKQYISEARFEKIAYQKIIPIRKNETNGKIEFLESYEPKWDFINSNYLINQDLKNKKTNSVSNSVLSSGKWYKIGLTQEGVYKLDKNLLERLGVDIASVNPRKIKIFGNGGKMLPEKNSVFRNDDLIENSILVVGENDGIFNETDYVLFYGQSTETWKYNASNNLSFSHVPHSFSDTSFYFINVDGDDGKRITNIASASNTPLVTTNTHDFYGNHELNLTNVVKSGRAFFGEKFDFNTSYSYNFNIPDAVVGDSVTVYASVLSRSNIVSNYNVNFNTGNFNLLCNATNINFYIADVGYVGEGQKTGPLSSSILSVNVSKQTSQAIGWLDKITYNARRYLVFNQQQFNYRDKRLVSGTGTYAKYILTNSNVNAPFIWDVTNPLDVKNQLFSVNGNQFEYIASADSLREYCVFTVNQAYKPVTYGLIPNQNLHGIQQADYIIVTHPNYLSEASRIAKIHEDIDSLSYTIVTTQQIYNEFSSGTPDIVGIRDFVKMLYFKPSDPTKAVKYLLLFGDGSYKNKEISNSTNSALIPTYQTYNSTSYTSSFVTDDFFAMMDAGEGDLQSNDVVDIGVGRFPVKTKAEAIAVTNKVEAYYRLNYGFDVNAIESSCNVAETNYPQGDWRNWVCFVADDEDNNEHINQANALGDMVYNNQKEYNVDKIFLDAYKQYSTPGGSRYPDAVEDLNRRMDKGALIVNYTGHGGELGLAEERIVDVPQILAWKNINNMPLMVTATCEFSRFDDPDRTSAGEYCLLNPNGGAIALMTTVRLAFSGLNFSLNTAFYNHALYPLPNGKMPAIGDLYRLTKRDLGFNPQFMNFVILGDPALKLSYPKQKIYASTINSQTLTPTSSDTLKALSRITVSGYVGDNNGNKLNTYNGVVYPTVFDRELNINSLSNDAGSPQRSFKLQKNIIYRGKSEVKNGEFSFSFLVPKDINYDFGKGKLSFYAHNGLTDAHGYYDKVVVGGSNPNAIIDNVGPVVNLYMNDEKFVTGGLTNENPSIFAIVSDSSGINTLGTGIGHDVVAILNENTSKPIVLNDFYSADLNTYQKGKIRYPFNSLDEGTHRLSLKVWDVQNNSSTAFTEFVVAKKAELALKHVLNYPNPFTTKTQFFIEHNQCCTTMKALIQIYTLSGKIVKSINHTIYNEGFRLDGIEWDGKDEFGDKLAKGVYIYKVSITDNTQKKAEKIEKLVILN